MPNVAEHSAGASCEDTLQLQITHVPAIDSVLFGSPKDSVTDIIQIAGRAMRPHGDADTATIIVPALLPDSPGDDDDDGPGTSTCCASSGRCAPMMRPSAPGWERPRRQGPQRPGRAAAASADHRAGPGGHAGPDREHGNLDAPTGYLTTGGFRLGAWLTAQRADRNSGTMPADRIRPQNPAG